MPAGLDRRRASWCRRRDGLYVRRPVVGRGHRRARGHHARRADGAPRAARRARRPSSPGPRASRGCSSARRPRWPSRCRVRAAAALDLTSTYVKERKQFGRAIATFQAVSQRAADTYINKEAIKLTSWQAAWRLDTGKPATTQVATAKYWAAQGGQDVLLAAHHLHGGVGVDRDYPLYRYFLLAKQMELDLGSETPTLMHLGALLAETPGRLTRSRASAGSSSPVGSSPSRSCCSSSRWPRRARGCGSTTRPPRTGSARPIASRPGRSWASPRSRCSSRSSIAVHGVAHGVVASLGVFGGVVGAALTGSLVSVGPARAVRCRRAGRGHLEGVGAAHGDQVKYVVAGGRQLSPSTYEKWAYAHLGLAGLVLLALVLLWLRTRSSTRPEAASPALSS